MRKPAVLLLEDGSRFDGYGIGADGGAVGEVVFNTSMTGYQEILTDPSYRRQLVTLTYPHIGNTGANPEDDESGAVQASGLIIRDLPLQASNWRQQWRLDEYLRDQGVVAMAGIDTRQLTRLLTEKGAQRGVIQVADAIDLDAMRTELATFPGLQGMDLAREVTVAERYAWREGSWRLGEGFARAGSTGLRVVAYDFGVKRNILRMLVDRGCELTVVPAATTAEEVLALQPDGVFLSNGPGDPEPCDYAIGAIAELLQRQLPMFGICLGHQLLSLASGARTVKMKFGHHGANHPVQDLASGLVYITSQNHGFAVDEASLPPCLRATHRSLFDGSLQGVEHTENPAFGFQGHPEASPGPHDIAPLFDRFVQMMQTARA